LNYAYERIGQQMMELNQQYVRDAQYVEVVGLDSDYELKTILPEMLQGSYRFDIGPMNESLMRQEKRAEQIQLYDKIMQTAQILVMMGAPPNGRALAEDLLEAYDKHDLDRYFAAQPPPQAPPGVSGAGGEQQQGGQTNPGLAAGPQSPSSQLSMSPEMFAQQQGAARGGGLGG
jgi:hypothetical protein